MSKKARLKKKIRRNLQAAWHDSRLQKDLQQSFVNLLYFGVTGIVTDKDGNTRVATKEEIEEALNNGVATRESNETYHSLINKYIQDDVKQELDKQGYKIKIAPNKDYQ